MNPIPGILIHTSKEFLYPNTDTMVFKFLEWIPLVGQNISFCPSKIEKHKRRKWELSEENDFNIKLSTNHLRLPKNPN